MNRNLKSSSKSLYAMDNIKFIPLCHNCYLVPSIEILDKFVNVKCKCQFEKNLPIEEYIHLIQSKTIPKQCYNHKNNKFIKFCLSCGEWLCIDCIEEHKEYKKLNKHISIESYSISLCNSHNRQLELYCDECNKNLCLICLENHNDHHIYNLKSLSLTVKKKDIKKQLINKDNQFKEYYSKLRDEYINKINQAYEEGLKKNRLIIRLGNILIDDYTDNQINNFYLTKNIIYNTNLYMKEFQQGQDVISYLLKCNLKPKPFVDDLNKFKIKTELNSLYDLNILQLVKEEYSIFSLLVLKDDRLASCISNGSIKIYNQSQNYNCDITIKAHSGSIRYISQLDEDKIISSSFDGTVKLWKIKQNDYQCLATFEGHSKYVNKAIPLPHDRIASCSDDKTVKLWNSISPYKCIQTVKEHKGEVSSLLLMSNNKYLISCSYEESSSPSVIVFKVNENQIKIKNKINNLECHTPNSIIELEDNIIATGGKSYIWIVNILNEEIEKKIPSNNSINCLLLLKNGNLMVGDQKGVLSVYDEEGNILQEKKCHDKYISCVVFINHKTIATCSGDEVIKIWR